MNNLIFQLAQVTPDKKPWQLGDGAGPNDDFGGLENAPKYFSENWGGGEMADPRWLLAAAVCLTGLLLIAASMRRRDNRVRTRPWAVFRAAAGELNLNLADKWMLFRIARYQRLLSPLTLVLSPTTLRHHAVHYATHLPAAARLRLMYRVRAIRRRMVSE